MKEFSFDIEEALQVGLRDSHKRKANSGLFTEMVNIEPSPYGAVPFSYVPIPWTADQLFNIGIELDFPFPQIIRLHKFTLLMGADYAFYVNEADWSLVALETYDFHSTGNTKSIKTGGYWQAADFWDCFILTNGICSLWYNRATDKLLVEDTVRFQTVTDYKGRALFGGFDPDYHWNANWAAYWAALTNTITGGEPRALDANWLKWTSIGSGLDALIEADQTQLELLKNDFGDMPMEDRAGIAHVEKLGEKLLVYSYKSVTVVSHKSQPLSTIGIDKYELAPGVHNVGALSGNRNHHVYVASDKTVWWIDSNFKPHELGYKEFIDEMTGDIIVSINPETKGFYIASQDKTYVLTWNIKEDRPQGFAEAEQRVTSCVSNGVYAYGLGTHVDLDLEVIKWNAITDEFDAKRTGDKSVRWITFFGSEGRVDETAGTVQARVHYKNDYRKDFGQTSWRTINKKGSCYFPIVGKNFKVELRGDDFREINIHRIEVSIQIDDNRFTRGINVNQINS